jgi:hypothetical protein
MFAIRVVDERIDGATEGEERMSLHALDLVQLLRLSQVVPRVLNALARLG